MSSFFTIMAVVACVAAAAIISSDGSRSGNFGDGDKHARAKRGEYIAVFRETSENPVLCQTTYWYDYYRVVNGHRYFVGVTGEADLLPYGENP